MTPDWIAADWGTTRLRVWAMDGAGAVLARAESDAGMARLERGGFEAALLTLVADWLSPRPAGAPQMPVIACGMVGARQGWVEAPYRSLPCTPLDAAGLVPAPVADARLAVRVIPGVKQTAPPDVMRGEETQIGGFLRSRPDFIGTLCLPGTHTKWVGIAGGRIERFRSFMTGELFALLSQASVLRHSVAAEGRDEASFLAGVETGYGRPQALAESFFALRAAALLEGLAPVAARARLSGLLIGAELAARAADGALDGDRRRGTLVVAGAPDITDAYRLALSHLGHACTAITDEMLVLDGLRAARTLIGERT